MSLSLANSDLGIVRIKAIKGAISLSQFGEKVALGGARSFGFDGSLHGAIIRKSRMEIMALGRGLAGCNRGIS